MPKLTLELESLSVETFAAADDEVMKALLAATGSKCSAIDACPTRLCDTSLC